MRGYTDQLKSQYRFFHYHNSLSHYVHEKEREEDKLENKTTTFRYSISVGDDSLSGESCV
jgi:hypothetical protein